MAMATKLCTRVNRLDGPLLKSGGLMRWRTKLKPLYLYYHSAYGYKNWYVGDLLWWPTKHKVIQRFDHVLLKAHVANDDHYISTNKVLLATKVGRMITW